MIWGPKIDHFIINNAILKGRMYKKSSFVHHFIQLSIIGQISNYIEYTI